MEDREENCLPQELFWAFVKFRVGPSIANLRTQRAALFT